MQIERLWLSTFRTFFFLFSLRVVLTDQETKVNDYGNLDHIRPGDEKLDTLDDARTH